MNTRFLALGLAALALPSMAQAQGMSDPRGGGVYIGAAGFGDFREESDINGNAIAGDASYNIGYGGAAMVGYAFGGGPRVELEVGHRRNEADSVNVAGLPAGASLDSHHTSVMANFLYDFAVGSNLTPYIGAGLGGAFVDQDDAGSDTVFAYQAIAGVGYAITDRLTAFLDYRYFGTEDLKVDDTGTELDIDNYHHTVGLGLRYLFPMQQQVAALPVAPAPRPVAPPPPRVVAPPPPQPLVSPASLAPPPPRNYLVFFDFDRATVSPAALDVLRDAAQNARDGRMSRIMVTGHADRAGSRTYNAALSERRARAVQEQLSRLGIDTGDMSLFAKGETEPLVSTRDGVREPQNRRVEIVLN